MEHLSLEIFDLATAEDKNPTTSKYAMLPEDASITITDTSEIFASGDVWSHDFSLNVRANAHIFGSAGDMHGSRLHDQLDKRKARLWVEGLPLYLGYLRLGDEAEVDEDGNVDVTFESGQKTFDDLIEGAKANQVPLMGDVLIGVALWRKRKVRFSVNMQAGLTFTNGMTSSNSGTVKRKILGEMTDVLTFGGDGENENTPVQEYPAMVFPKGEFMNADTGLLEQINCLNTDSPYMEDADGTPTNPYCNVALCYQKQGYDKKDDLGNITPDYSSEPEAQRGYEVMPANRVNSAPNFYVIYWLRALMKHLGIHIDENQMMDVEDMRRLFFVNTRCAYREPQYIRSTPPSQGFGRYRFSGDRLVPEFIKKVGGKETVNFDVVDEWEGYEDLINKDECGFTVTVKSTSGIPVENIKSVNVTVSKVLPWDEDRKDEYLYNNSWLHEAYATNDCFPDVDISEVIQALESGFGVRFLFDENYNRVRIVLLRNIFRSSDVQAVNCEIVSDGKVENNIRGFRMTYGNTEDSHFYYKGFADKLPHMKTLWPDESDKHDYSQWKLDAEYADLLNKVSAFNKICYVTPNNGNAYGIKVDKDAKRYEELHPSLFEYAGFMDAEDGDCTGEEETIETIEMGFTPAIMNDVNFEDERTGKTAKQRFALFVDEKMRPRRPDLGDLSAPHSYNDSDAYYDVSEMYKKYGPAGSDSNMTHDDGIVAPGEFAVASDIYAMMDDLEAEVYVPISIWAGASVKFVFDIRGHLNEGYRLYLQDNFEPNDDGVSPIEKHDWGLTLGIMRGSGSDAGVVYESDPDDLEDNDTWHVEPGSSTASHPDTCDSYGKLFDYTADGREDEQDPTGRFSLKLRAEKPNPYYDPTQEDGPTNKRYLDITDSKLKHRGLADQFYKEYSYWVRNARIAKRTVRMELADFLAIDKTKKVTVGDITGFIRKRQFTVSNKAGLGMVTMEIMYI